MSWPNIISRQTTNYTFTSLGGTTQSTQPSAVLGEVRIREGPGCRCPCPQELSWGTRHMLMNGGLDSVYYRGPDNSGIRKHPIRY